MGICRRTFIKDSLLLGGALLFPTRSLCVSRKEAEWQPAYAKLEAQGELAQRVEQAYAMLAECVLCPRQCGVNRLAGEKGFCRAPAKAMVYSAHPHFGEEISLVGKHGSGTIFFSNCNLRCVFCQNWPISIEGQGREIEDETLAGMMLHLQQLGCHNINLVTPTHVMPNILAATQLACRRGLQIPLVYNTSGYELADVIGLLDGVVDIYLPDMKYMHPDHADRYSPGASDYPACAQAAVIEMNRQVGQHRVDAKGVARRGLMIRHLVMPGRVAGTFQFVQWVAENLPKSTYINIMHQYHVDYKAFEYPEIWRSITADEYLEAMRWAEEAGLTNLDPNSLKVRRFYERHYGKNGGAALLRAPEQSVRHRY